MQADEPVSLSPEFFEGILARTRDVEELKLVLYVAQLSARSGRPAVSQVALEAPEIMRSVVGLDHPEPAEERLQRALGRAVANGSLLRITVGTREARYLMATDENRVLLRRLIEDTEAGRDLGLPEGEPVRIYRPNAFALYEQHIGPLTPLVAERVREAERSYPRSWIERAMAEAVQYNRRNWRYVETILERWTLVGGPDEAHGRRA